MTLSERALSAQAALFARYDKLNALWLDAEKRLTAMHVPHAVSYCFDEEQDECGNPCYCHYLGVQKAKGKWRICYAHDHILSRSDLEWTPITDCSAEDRVKAVSHVRELEERLVEAAEKFVSKTDDAIAKLSDYLN